jgi:hypothetical protein
MTEQIVRQFHFYKRLSPLTTCVADRRVTIHPVAFAGHQSQYF